MQDPIDEKLRDAAAGVHGVMAIMSRNLVKPKRRAANGRTIAGARNRWLRDRGLGEPLYVIEDRQLLFEGFDAEDRRLFIIHHRDTLPYGFFYEDIWNERMAEWINEHTAGLFRHTFDPMFMVGEIYFADPNDAFFFKLTMTRKEGDGLGKVGEIAKYMGEGKPVMGNLVERICLRNWFSGVAWMKSWFGGRHASVRRR